MKIDLSIKLCSETFKNPTVLFSGILVTPAELIQAARNGAGAVTTKSISLEERVGHPHPTIVRFDHGFLNSVGLKNPGLKMAREEVGIGSAVYPRGKGAFLKIQDEMEKFMTSEGYRTLGEFRGAAH